VFHFQLAPCAGLWLGNTRLVICGILQKSAVCAHRQTRLLGEMEIGQLILIRVRLVCEETPLRSCLCGSPPSLGACLHSFNLLIFLDIQQSLCLPRFRQAAAPQHRFIFSGRTLRPVLPLPDLHQFAIVLIVLPGLVLVERLIFQIFPLCFDLQGKLLGRDLLIFISDLGASLVGKQAERAQGIFRTLPRLLHLGQRLLVVVEPRKPLGGGYRRLL